MIDSPQVYQQLTEAAAAMNLSFQEVAEAARRLEAVCWVRGGPDGFAGVALDTSGWWDSDAFHFVPGGEDWTP